MRANLEEASSVAAADDAMSDCMKAMQANGADTSKIDCKCCDTKQKCPDAASCMTKCCKVLGMVKPAGKTVAIMAIQYRHAETAKPPDWLNTPPAPPPRS